MHLLAPAAPHYAEWDLERHRLGDAAANAADSGHRGARGQQQLGHGLDAEDNEFVIGLVGKELHPLSHLVQTMRKTRQTSEFISQMGPFFVGHVVARHPLPGDLAPEAPEAHKATEG